MYVCIKKSVSYIWLQIQICENEKVIERTLAFFELDKLKRLKRLLDVLQEASRKIAVTLVFLL